MIELLGGKAGVSCGRFHYGSAFGEPSGHADKVETIRFTFSLSVSLLYSLAFFIFLFFLNRYSLACFQWFNFLTYDFLLCDSQTLVKHGFSYSGKDLIYSGLDLLYSENYPIIMSNHYMNIVFS